MQPASFPKNATRWQSVGTFVGMRFTTERNVAPGLPKVVSKNDDISKDLDPVYLHWAAPDRQLRLWR